MTTESLALDVGAGADPLGTWPNVDRRVRTTDRRRQSHSDRRASGTAGDTLEVAYLLCRDDVKQCTERELQVVRLLLNGMSNKQIAQALEIREDTVKKHLQHVYTKLGIHRRELLMLGRTSA
jgi:ATP/maltotriose-dependent transcriptional regulator MalT